MKKQMIAAALASFGLVLMGCPGPINTPDGGMDASVDPATEIQTTWVSQGTDVAPLLAGGPFYYRKITATFKTDNSYTVSADSQAPDAGSATTYTFTGTYTTAEATGTTIRTVSINQAAPSVATSAGIYQVDASGTPVKMTYEVVQTSGTSFSPPTPTAGFGSTNGGSFGTSNVQKYVKQ